MLYSFLLLILMAVIISADEIKKEFAGYDPSHASQFHRQSAKLADLEFAQQLKQSRLKKVILLNGGSASGKTEYLSSHLSKQKAIIFDGTLSTKLGAKIKLKKIFKVKKQTEVHAVIPRDLNRAYLAFLNRERHFADEAFLKTHSGARTTLLWLARNYQ